VTTWLDPETEPSRGRRLRLPAGMAMTDVAGYAMVVLLVLVGSVAVNGFLSTSTLRAILQQGSAIGIVALGQMFVVLVSGLDLSVSAVMLFSVMILLKEGTSVSSILLAIAISAAVGLINGLFVTWRRAPAFVATFGTLILVGGIEAVYTGGSSGGSVPSWLGRLGSGLVGGIPVSIFALVLLSLIVWFTLARTTVGRWIYAVGTNDRAALYSGIRVYGVRIGCYVVCSLLAFAGALVMAGYVGFIDQTFAASSNLDSIAAVMIGGVVFGGGVGRVSNVISGVFIIAIAQNLVSLLGLSLYWQDIVVGAILVLAVVVQSVDRGGLQAFVGSVRRRPRVVGAA
jgi:ribose/xylose/arabinose/galactoside ABC-type transport system permease subunit